MSNRIIQNEKKYHFFLKKFAYIVFFSYLCTTFRPIEKFWTQNTLYGGGIKH